MHNELITAIRSANASEIEDILHLAIEKKRQLFPDWDIIYLALPKTDKYERKRTLDYLVKLYSK